MKYTNPSRTIWKDLKMKSGRTKAKWSGRNTDAMGLKAFKEGTSIKKLKSVW
jgi:hypothetical protein